MTVATGENAVPTAYDRISRRRKQSSNSTLYLALGIAGSIFAVLLLFVAIIGGGSLASGGKTSFFVPKDPDQRRVEAWLDENVGGSIKTVRWWPKRKCDTDTACKIKYRVTNGGFEGIFEKIFTIDQDGVQPVTGTPWADWYILNEHKYFE